MLRWEFSATVVGVTEHRSAYVFWHRARPGVPLTEYEQRLRAFHDGLRVQAPAGLLRSYTFALSDAPWIVGDGPAYEDWYEITSSTALDVLNDVAVSAPMRPFHDPVAHLAAAGTGGVMRLLRDADEADGVTATWCSKPDGQSYASFRAALAKLSPEWSVWQRQMALGPAREFLVSGPDAALDLRADRLPIVIRRRVAARSRV